MADEPRSVTKLIAILRSDDSDVRQVAARLIWERYFRALLSLARKNLGQSVRRREDEEDVLQRMYDSFCRRQARGDFDLTCRDDLWALLVQITLRKARNTANKHRVGKRDVNREEPEAAQGSALSQWALESMEDATPTPVEATILNEALELRLQSLLDPELRQIAIWKLEGWTNKEIADHHGCVERTVERKLERIRSRWLVGG